MEAIPYAKTSIHTMAIGTRAYMHERHDIIRYEPCKICPLCQGADETIDHMFFGCPISKAWHNVQTCLAMWQEMTTSNRMLRVFHRHIIGNGKPAKACQLAMSCMVFLIWQTWNQCQYKADIPNIERMFVKI